MQLILFLVMSLILGLVFTKRMSNKGRAIAISVIIVLSVLIYNKYGGF